MEYFKKVDRATKKRVAKVFETKQSLPDCNKPKLFLTYNPTFLNKLA